MNTGPTGAFPPSNVSPSGVSMPHKERIIVKKLHPDAKLPARQPASDCYDLYSNMDITCNPGQVAPISTDIAIQLPSGFAAIMRDRSSMAAKGLTCYLHKSLKLDELGEWLEENEHVIGGMIDNAYRGHWKVLLLNTTNDPIVIKKHDRIAQFLVIPMEYPDVVDLNIVEGSLSDTERGEGGFGSTGR